MAKLVSHITSRTFEVVVSAPDDLDHQEIAKQLRAVTEVEGVSLHTVNVQREMLYQHRHLSPEVSMSLVLMRRRGCSLYRVPSKREAAVRDRMDGLARVTLDDASYLLMVNLRLITFTAQDKDLDRYDLSERGREVADELEQALTKGGV